LEEDNKKLRSLFSIEKKENEELRKENKEMKKDNENLLRDDEINRLFNNNRKKETINKEDIEAFIDEFDEFDKMFDKYLNERQQRLRELIQEMNNQFE